MPSQLITVIPDERFIVLQLQVPSLDSEACEELEATLANQVERRDLPVMIDLSRARFLPSLAIGSLVHIRRMLDEKGRTLSLVGLAPNIRKAMELNNLQRLFGMYETFTQAAEQIGVHG